MRYGQREGTLAHPAGPPTCGNRHNLGIEIGGSRTTGLGPHCDAPRLDWGALDDRGGWRSVGRDPTAAKECRVPGENLTRDEARERARLLTVDATTSSST